MFFVDNSRSYLTWRRKWDETSSVSGFFFSFNAENVFVCVSSLFLDKISTGWIHAMHAVWLHMDESKSFCRHKVIGSLTLRDSHTISKLTVLQTQIEKKGSATLNVWNRNILLAMESADKNVHDIAACSNSDSRIDRGNSGRGKSEKPCCRCDGKHSPDYCRFRNATCDFCQKTGHISAACLKRKATKGTRNRRTHLVDSDEHDDDTHTITSGDTALVHKLFRISRMMTLQWILPIFTDIPQRIQSFQRSTKLYDQEQIYWRGPSTQRFIQRDRNWAFENGCLLRGSRVIIPHILRQQVLKELHQST